ncbi:MAG: bifunctional [glutamate--ammonia ligase]-adenylyl-L-tyrosine phosphorylase/[glutamate--ammonia-ligase] adenylyltransferase [Pirellulales bacterium]|nr:bifunctional [glutamate--ammonia ligase]-adenylyl-L-tyrosine phosphorylase/[glutamate--ammonia-ligase] adenylyltransferase [Pirellulales bacterium]
MDIPTLRHALENATAAAGWLRGLGVSDAPRAHANLVAMAKAGLSLDLLAVVCDLLEQYLGRCPDPDMALNNLSRFVAAARNPLSAGTLFERDPESLAALLAIFSNSQHLSDLLILDGASLDVLRLTEGRPVARQALVDELVAEVEAVEHEHAVLAALRRFKQRETLRIAYGDIVRAQGLDTVTRQISFVADAVIEAALRAATRKVEAARGQPKKENGEPASMIVLAMGKLGGVELNYSSDVDLIFLHDEDGRTDGRRAVTNGEFFGLVARECTRLLTEQTDMGAAYRVDLRLRPEGERGPMVASVASALAYYENRGRTWERQALIKARPVAGNLAAGSAFLDRLKPWIFRRYLTRADISGIQTLKRRIERRAHRDGVDARDVKTGHGGIRDVEFVIQFLQLLNGAGEPAVQTGNTLEAIARLEHVGCLNNQERTFLEDNYTFLRNIEHRLQILFDLQTHLLPESPDELRKLALRMGYPEGPGRSALEAFEADYRQRTALNRRILDHLLHDAFPDDDRTEAEVDLVLDPRPPDERIVEVLGKYPFRDVKQAYRNLSALAEERIRFLSTRRCRHFLAAIAPQLLAAIAQTPDPDSTLVNLDQVSQSLGSKGVLWELFSLSPPSLALCVDLCAYSPHLCGILTSNPGMIDGLMDSLVLDRLPSADSLRRALADLCWAAEDIDPILHSFKNDQQLRVGVRDVLGKEDVRATTEALSAIAEVCLDQIAAAQFDRLVAKYGRPTLTRAASDGKRRGGRPCDWVILGMGKLGGREMNYHSDLDLVFLYEAEGRTVQAAHFGRDHATTHQHFFSELAQRIIQATSRLGPLGRLYEIDARLRPTGKSGALAVSLDELARYFAEGDGQLWERQALCKARVVFGSPRAARRATHVAARAAFNHRWQRADAQSIRRMRQRQEKEAPAGDLKRAAGGLVDIEFLVQMLQLRFGRRDASLRQPNTLDALAALREAGHLGADDSQFLADCYRFLRTVESRLSLIGLTARSSLPDDPTDAAKLAHLLGYADTEPLLADHARWTAENRRRFDRLFDEAER